MAKDCHDTALRYLEHRERSAYEVKTHLISKGFEEEETEEELIRLKELHYIDDARYSSDYIRYGMGKGRGPVRLQHELRDKGIETELIQIALEDNFTPHTEREEAMKEAQKVLKSTWRSMAREEENQGEPGGGLTDEKTLAKIGRKLSSLGYHTDVIYEVLGKLRKSG